MRTKLGVLFALVLATAIFAGGRRLLAQDNGAIILTIQTSCHFFDADGAWTLAIGDCSFRIVATPHLEVVNVTVRGLLPPSTDGARWDFESTQQPCVIDNTPYSTTRWQETVSPSGEVSMHCDFR